jgi:tetratricopeptide (TPR) repeat protein
MRNLFLAGVLTVGGLASSWAWAMYFTDDLVDVPVDRIVSNLEARLRRHPANAELHHALARAHAIAYARGEASLKLARPRVPGSDSKEPDERQLAHQTSVPEVRADGGADPAARRHLEEAVKHYHEATRLDPDNLTAALGYGWSLAQSGDDSDAREQYQAVLREAIEREWYFLAREAGSYLLPLLSRFSQPHQRAELEKTLEDLDKRIKERGRAVTPILVPLVANASFDDLVSREAAVAFDLDGSGFAHRWQWITPRAGWLVYQGTGERLVDSGIRIIGGRTFWIFWSDGYAAMAALDDDGDGWLSGHELEGLAIWQDLNANGVVERGEIRPLANLGIVALSCAHVRHAQGFEYSPGGVVFADGSVRPSYDWIATSLPAKSERVPDPRGLGRPAMNAW